MCHNVFFAGGSFGDAAEKSLKYVDRLRMNSAHSTSLKGHEIK